MAEPRFADVYNPLRLAVDNIVAGATEVQRLVGLIKQIRSISEEETRSLEKSLSVGLLRLKTWRTGSAWHRR